MQLDAKQWGCSNNIYSVGSPGPRYQLGHLQRNESLSRLFPPPLTFSFWDFSHMHWKLFGDYRFQVWFKIWSFCSVAPCVPSVWVFVAFNFGSGGRFIASEQMVIIGPQGQAQGGRLKKTLIKVQGVCDSLGLTPGQEWGCWWLPTCSLASNKCQLIFLWMVGMLPI